jgi:HD-GYP domain-containing protein (c-di-GMP phosphodiesterase class II)
MVNYTVSEIAGGTKFKSDVVVDSLFLIATPPCAVSASTLSLLRKWGFKEIFSEDEGIAEKIAKQAAKKDESEEEKKAEQKKLMQETEEVDLSEFTDDAPKIAEEDIPDEFKTSEEVDLSEFTDDAPSASSAEKKDSKVMFSAKEITSRSHSSLTDFLAQKNPEAADDALKFSVESNVMSLEEDKNKMRQAQKTYEAFMDFITQVFTKYATQKIINQPELNGKVLELCNFIRENKKFILRVQPNFETRNKNFIISHTMRTTVISIVIGLQIKIPYEKLIELGVASVLHEIGQIRLPSQLYMNDQALSPAQKAQMQTHTLIGCNIAKEAGFPRTVQFGILDHHERENGSGYPRKLHGNGISLYAKIIGVACSFEAITAPRHYKGALTTFEGMVKLLKNEGRMFDDTIVKALLLSLSLYPIGAFVFLSNGKIGQVVDISPSNPKFPIVQIVGGINPDGSPKRIQTDNGEVKIVRVMNQEESEDLRKSLGDII